MAWCAIDVDIEDAEEDADPYGSALNKIGFFDFDDIGDFSIGWG